MSKNSTTAIFDSIGLTKNYHQLPKVYKGFVLVLLNEERHLVNSLIEQVETAQWDELMYLLHKYRGQVLNVGAIGLASKMEELEVAVSAADPGDMSWLKAEVQLIRQLWMQTSIELRGFAKAHFPEELDHLPP